MDPYRTGRSECERCVKLEAEIRRLKGEDVGIQPYPADLDQSNGKTRVSNNHVVHCPFCTAKAGWFWRAEHDYQTHIWYFDSSICIGDKRSGFLWFNSCGVSTPHRHRECRNCRRRWIEHARPEGWKP